MNGGGEGDMIAADYPSGGRATTARNACGNTMRLPLRFAPAFIVTDSETSLAVRSSHVPRAALLMVASACCFGSMAIAIRLASAQLHPFEIAFFRSVFGLLFALPLLARAGPQLLRTRRLPLHLFRNVFHFGGQTLWFLGLTLMPIAIVFSLEFTIPIWSAIFAGLFLGERMNLGRAVAIVLGFIGVLVIVQPGMEAFNPNSIIVLVAAILFASSNICTKPLSRTDTPLAIIFYMNIIQMPLGLIASGYFGWVWPTWAHLPWIVVVGVAGLSAHFCMTRAFMLADATMVLPFDYLRLPLAAVIGLGRVAIIGGLALVAGAAIIFSGNFYSLRYEARRNKKGGPQSESRPSSKADAAA